MEAGPVKIKICGNRTLDDVEITCGADAQGFIVGIPSSPRNLEPRWAKWLINAVKLFNTAVLVTQVSDPVSLAALVDEVRPDAVQIHKELSPLELEQIRWAIPMSIKLYSLLSINGSSDDLIKRALHLAQPPLDALLLDSRHGGRLGGTGLVHNWQISRVICDAIQPFPVILAGGITPKNIHRAIEKVQPYAVDVSSGVEENGQKCREKVEALLQTVRTYE